MYAQWHTKWLTTDLCRTALVAELWKTCVDFRANLSWSKTCVDLRVRSAQVSVMLFTKPNQVHYLDAPTGVSTQIILIHSARVFLLFSRFRMKKMKIIVQLIGKLFHRMRSVPDNEQNHLCQCCTWTASHCRGCDFLMYLHSASISSK